MDGYSLVYSLLINTIISIFLIILGQELIKLNLFIKLFTYDNVLCITAFICMFREQKCLLVPAELCQQDDS